MKFGRGFVSALTGSFSSPADGNPTGIMVEAAYRHHGLDIRYINCDVVSADLANAVAGARAMGWLGFNCSLPHKETVIPLLDEVRPAVHTIGAVNCVAIHDGRLVGDNTDGKGFLTSLRTAVDPSGKRIVILGAGGAARAIAVECVLAGVESITIVNRDTARGSAVVEAVRSAGDADVAFAPWQSSYRIPEGTDVVVNATPVGMVPDVEAIPDIDLASINDDMVVADVVPNPATTALLASAAKAGARTLDGRGMLVAQAVAGIEMWTGQQIDSTVMRDALATALAATRRSD